MIPADRNPDHNSNPLLDLHRQAQAELQNYGEVEIVSTFGELAAEYGAVRKSAGLIDRPQRGVIHLTGKDRLSFLNNLLTNQTWDKTRKSGLTAGQSVYAYLLDAKTGRVQTDLTVIEQGDAAFIELDRRVIPQVLASFEKYKFAEAIEFHDRSNELHQIALHGNGAEKIVAEAIAPEIARFRDDACGVPGIHLLIPINRAREIWMNLLTRYSAGEEIGKRPLRPIGWAAFNTCRIEAGRALFGIDFDDTFVPAETGELQMSRAVSFTKGCYPGQEIVARMHARQQVAKRIVGVRMESDALPIAGAQVFDEQSNTIGAVTSSTISPVLSNAAISLAIVKRPHFEIGKELRIPAEGAIRKARVVQLPFLPKPQ